MSKALHGLTVCLLAALGLIVGQIIDMGGTAVAQERAGVTAAVRGQVSMLASLVAPKEAIGRQMKSGQSIHLGDQIETLSASGMQAILLDETTFTMGPDSLITFDEFVYDPGGDGSMVASVARGAFRYVSGAIAARDPSSVQIKLPMATVGIRGTIAGGFTDGSRAVVALFGPGPRNTSSDRFGRVVVSNAAGSVEISRPGFAVVVEGPGVPPSQPQPITAEQLALLGTVQPLPPPDTDDGVRVASGRSLSGEGIIAGLPSSIFESRTGDLLGTADPGLLLTQAVSRVTSRAQLLALNTTIVFSQSNVPLSDGGFYDLQNFKIDLGTLAVSGDLAIASILFPGSGDPAFQGFLTADFLSQTIELGDPNCALGVPCTFNATFLNTGGVTAKTLAHSLDLNNGAVTGSGTTRR